MEAKQKKEWQKIILKKIGMVYTKAEQTARMFSRTSVRIESFQGICKELHSPIEDWMSPQLKELITKFNECFDKISEVCSDYARLNDSDYIPVEYIKIIVDKSLEDLKPLLNVK